MFVKRSLAAAAAVVVLAGASTAARADLLFSNGPIVTNPTGGTGTIAGQPISSADGFNVPGSTFLFSTTGIGATQPNGNAVADDFTVGPGGWDAHRHEQPVRPSPPLCARRPNTA